MIVTYNANPAFSYASLSPRPSRATLRKKRIRKDSKGYVDLLFTLDSKNNAYVKAAKIELISDGIYSTICNFEISVLTPDRQYVLGSAKLTYSKVWHIGEKVYIGDTDYNDQGEGHVAPLAKIFSNILSSELYTPFSSYYLRITFDREDFYTWDRGFFIKPDDLAPKLILDVGDYITDYRELFIKVEDVIPHPSIQQIYVFSARHYVESQGIYVYSKPLDSRTLFAPVYREANTFVLVYARVTQNPLTPPVPSPPQQSLIGERGIFIKCIGTDFVSSRSLYIPHTNAEEDNYFINSNVGSDDFSIEEARSVTTPLKSFDEFFYRATKETLNDLDSVNTSGDFRGQLLFNLETLADSPTTPIVIKSNSPDGENTIFEGHIATEKTYITNLTFEKITFIPSLAITNVLNATTVNALHFTFAPVAYFNSTEDFYKITFKKCKFLVPSTFSNDFNSFINFDVTKTSVPIIYSFDECLIGFDGPGAIRTFINLTGSIRRHRIVFRNCSFFNPFFKHYSTAYNPDLLNFSSIKTEKDFLVNYYNCAFWNVTYQDDQAEYTQEYFRCYNGNPKLVENMVSNSNFGKISTSSPLYRKWLPRYGQNIGWDQGEIRGSKYYRCNIITQGADTKLLNHNIFAVIKVRDKYINEIGAAYGRSPFVADTNIRAKFSEVQLRYLTNIPLVKTLTLTQTANIFSSFPLSTDCIQTNLALLKYPILNTYILSIKDFYDGRVKNHIECVKDTKCPIIFRYGTPDWYEPIMGNKFMHFFEVYDNGSGVNISSLIINFNGHEYRYGNAAIRIEPLTYNNSVYRICFTSPETFLPEETRDIEITIYDCAGNKGPIWDSRRAPEILRFPSLTLAQKRQAMIPCFFVTYWIPIPIYTQSFEGVFPPPIHNRTWLNSYTEAFEISPSSLSQEVCMHSFEDVFQPYRLFLWESTYTEDIDSSIPDIPLSWIGAYASEDPSDLLPAFVILDGYDLEEVFSTTWESLYSDDFSIVIDLLNSLASLDFEESYSTTWEASSTEADPQNLVTSWDTLSTEFFEWFSPHIPVATVIWEFTFGEDEFGFSFDTGVPIFEENTELWAPYIITIGWSIADTQDFEYLNAVWSLGYSELHEPPQSFGWAEEIGDTFDYQSTIIWVEDTSFTFIWSVSSIPYTILSTFTFDVNFTAIFAEAFNSLFGFSGVTFNYAFVDNFETMFAPYRAITWGDVPIYTDSDPMMSVVWADSYSETFEIAVFVFNATPIFTSSLEELPLIMYNLMQTYIFELAVWSPAIYTEDYESTNIIDYAVQIEEDFEWGILANYEITPSKVYNMELVYIWVESFVDSYE